MGVNEIMNPHCHDISLPHYYTIAHVMEIKHKHIFLLDATSQNKSKVPEVNKITTEIQKQKKIHFNLNNADLEPNKKKIFPIFWLITRKTLLLI